METFGACTDSGFEGSRALNSDQLRGILMSLGGCLGFAGTVSTYFPFSVLGVVSFGLVVAFGALVFQKRRDALVRAARRSRMRRPPMVHTFGGGHQWSLAHSGCCRPVRNGPCTRGRD